MKENRNKVFLCLFHSIGVSKIGWYLPSLVGGDLSYFVYWTERWSLPETPTQTHPDLMFHQLPGHPLPQSSRQNYPVCVLHAKLLQSCSTPWDPMDYTPTRLLRPRDSPGKNTGVGCHFFLQEIFLTQGLSPSLFCLLHWQAGSLPLAHLRTSTISNPRCMDFWPWSPPYFLWPLPPTLAFQKPRFSSGSTGPSCLGGCSKQISTKLKPLQCV